jgi:hypothetical protein
LSTVITFLSFLLNIVHRDCPPVPDAIINPRGKTIETRFSTPSGYVRQQLADNTFGSYLRSLPLKSIESKVLLFNGQEKARQVAEGVVDMEIGTRDLQQCADACIRLRAEYLFRQKRYEDIHFNFTNGWRADYIRWRDGYRISVNGNKCEWKKVAGVDISYSSFRKYLDKVFSYAGTLSLSKEMKQTIITEINPGDVFIEGGSPGHAVIVVDVAINQKTGDKIFMLAQSYMPAQEIHILKNFNETSISPWYRVNENKDLKTPEWFFRNTSLKKFH